MADIENIVDNATWGIFVLGLFLANNFIFVGQKKYLSLIGRLGEGAGRHDDANDQRNLVTRALWLLTTAIAGLATFLFFRATVLDAALAETTHRLGYILWASLLGPFLFFYMIWPHVFFSWLDQDESPLSRKGSVVSSASAWAGIVIFCLSFVIYTTMTVLAWIFLRIGTPGGWAALVLYTFGWLTFFAFMFMVLWSFKTMAKRGAKVMVSYIKEEATRRQKSFFGGGGGYGDRARSRGWSEGCAC